VDIARDKAVSGGSAPPAAAQPGAGSATSGESFARPRTGSSSTAASAGASPSGTARPRGSPSARPSIAQFVSEIRAAFNARFYLFELEAKRAVWSAAYMLAFAVGAALLGVTAWLILIGALIYGAVTAGAPWLIATIVAIALHAVAVFLLIRAIRAMVDNLTFAATRRTLSKEDS
jgi:Putative Actinobacterial Holin-X, holin superfamily III